jgi:hypothetical protein
MNASTETRLKIMKGQRNFTLDLVTRLLAERDALVVTNAVIRKTITARISFIGGYVIQTENGAELCEPVPVVTVSR